MSKRRHNKTMLETLGNGSSFLKDVWRLIGICVFVWLWIPNISSNGRNDIHCSLKLLLSKNRFYWLRQ